MCGIAGAINDSRKLVIRGMLDRIKHRGPDDNGYVQFNNASIGNVRLSIVDVEGGHQPMYNSDKSSCIVYNGELYGYKNIRNQLKTEGYSFRTNCDTEVILAMYQKHGLDALNQMDGMFSFCIYDKQNECVVIARDHFGIKPLVYTICNNALYFSSEVKSFYAIPEWKAEPDMNAWHAFMNIRFPPSPNTLFKDVKKLPIGSYIYLSKNNHNDILPKKHDCVERFIVGSWNVGIYRYYSKEKKYFGLNYKETGEQLNNLLTKSLKKQMITDVDFGVYLSGGLDSSTLVALASSIRKDPLNSICLGFNEPSDENSIAQISANTFNTNHKDIYIHEAPLDHFKKIIYFMEEPKVNCIQGYLIAREAKKHQKVMLSGLGGDELFGGYDIYEIALYLDKICKPGIQSGASLTGTLIKTMLNLLPFFSVDNLRRGADITQRLSSPLDMYLILRNSWDHDVHLRKLIYKIDLVDNNAHQVRDHFKNRFPKNKSLAESFMQFEIENKMVDDFLTNEDRMSMAHGLEIRVPFLDRNVVEFASSMPLEYKIKINARKRILRSIMNSKLPDEILKKKKQGFSFNPVNQFKKDLCGYASKYLSRDRVEESGVFNYKYIEQILKSNPKPAMRWHYFLLWKIMGYHIWEDVFIKGGGTFE